MNKKKLSRDEFDILNDAERVAFYVYYMLVKKHKNECADIVGRSYGELIYNNTGRHILVYAKAREILKDDYGVDLMSLPFKDEKLKQDIQDVLNKDISINKINIWFVHF